MDKSRLVLQPNGFPKKNFTIKSFDIKPQHRIIPKNHVLELSNLML